MSAAAKRIEPYELENAKFMKEEFEKMLQALRAGKETERERKRLYNSVTRRVRVAKNSVERKANLTPKRKAEALKGRFDKIRTTLRNNRNYSTSIFNNGHVQDPIPVSYMNAVYRKAVIESVEAANKFKAQPSAVVKVKRTNEPPIKWRETNAAEDKPAKISTKILDGSIGKWKEGKLIKKGASVFVKVEAGKYTILGAFKTYDAAAVAAHPSLQFCSEPFWKEHEVFKDI